MNPIRPATYKVIRYILAHPEEALTQREAQRQTGVSLGQVNKVVNWLLTRGYLTKNRRSGLQLVNPGGLITLFALYRRMDDLKIGSFKIRSDVEQAKQYLIGQKGVFCLETALDEHSSYFRSPGVSCYVPESKIETITRDLKSASGGALPLDLYNDDLKFQLDVEGNHTSKIRTVIDLTCANRFYITRTLVKELWGLEIK